MQTGRFPTLRKVVTKMIEVAGAGCASAIAAFVLGNSHEAERPPMPVPPAVVHLAPADEQMIRHVRDESAALAERLRNTADAHSGTTAAPKPAKAATTTPARREQRTTRTAAAEAKQRPPEPHRAVEPAPATGVTAPAMAPYGSDRAPVANAKAAESNDARATPASAAPAELSQAPAEVPSRLFPATVSSVRDAPRPPLGVGEYLSSSM